MTEAVIPLPPGRKALVTITLMSGCIMVVLDSTIANVALPHMQASLGASSETITWVLTSYIIASAIAMPVTGWLTARFGPRLLFTLAVAAFGLSSALCGVANSLELMVMARLLQGTFGAFLMPISQALMYDINPPEKHAKAMTIWGLGVMVAPVVGPAFGGYLTENFDWRWVFFINVPIAIVTAIGSWLLLPTRRMPPPAFDFLGFGLLAVTLGSFQLMLDRGAQLDWFDSSEIMIEAAFAAGGLWMLVVHSVTARDPIIPTALVRDRNLLSAMIFATVIGGVMLSGAALLAPMLQRLMNYSVIDAGLMVTPRGAGLMTGMLLAGRLVTRVDGRLLIATGMVLIGWSLHQMSGFNLNVSMHLLVTTGIVQGLGMGMAVLPMNLLALATLPSAFRTQGAALYSLTRNLGGSVAIAISNALLLANVQTSHEELGSNVTTVTAPVFQSSILQEMGISRMPILSMIDAELNRQALMIAYIDDFWVMMWAAVLAIPLVLIMRKAKDVGGAHYSE